jgi:hypothetical protein
VDRLKRLCSDKILLKESSSGDLGDPLA